MSKVVKKIPELRFSGFEGEWEEKRLCDVVSYTKGYAFKSKNYRKNGIRIVRVSDLAESYIKTTSDMIFIDKKRLNDFRKYVLEIEDIIICTVGSNPELRLSSVGRGIFIDKDDEGLLNQNLLKINANHVVNNRFIFGYINSEKYFYYIKSIKRGNANQANITVFDLFKYKIHCPTLPEQTHIAAFLTSVDRRLSLLQKNKEALTTYKKGVMQKIFSRELRFKDNAGKDFPDWEEKRLGDVTNIYDGTHQTPKYKKDGIPFYSVENVTSNQFLKTKFISNDVYEKEKERVLLEKSDILMTRIGSIGKVKLIDWNVKASFYVSLALIKRQNSFSSRYLSYMIQANFFQRELWKKTIHVAFPQKINLGEIGGCKALLPSLPEQQKIASFLTDIDRSLETVSAQIESTQNWKKGLLQRMFI